MTREPHENHELEKAKAHENTKPKEMERWLCHRQNGLGNSLPMRRRAGTSNCERRYLHCLNHTASGTTQANEAE
ncbi:hypothetical protein VNO78_20198 [Psophocarpus tetragonolobus]|uniref:Uncharacterized protein n=1 Tax=Psophocarpus tetragonolobus TaxID=3891 RepID=A0AAN9XGI3_PSOTE